MKDSATVLPAVASGASWCVRDDINAAPRGITDESRRHLEKIGQQPGTDRTRPLGMELGATAAATAYHGGKLGAVIARSHRHVTNWRGIAVHKVDLRAIGKPFQQRIGLAQTQAVPAH